MREKRALILQKSETRLVYMGYLSSGNQDDWILAKYLFFFYCASASVHKLEKKKKKCTSPRWARKRHLARVANHSEGFDLGSRG